MHKIQIASKALKCNLHHGHMQLAMYTSCRGSTIGYAVTL